HGGRRAGGVHDTGAAGAGHDDRPAGHDRRGHRHDPRGPPATRRAAAPAMIDPRRSIPSVDRLLAGPAFSALLDEHPRALVVEAVQAVQGELRADMAGGAAAGAWDEARYASRTREVIAQLTRRTLVPVINATGVVLHTNLG